MTPAEMAALDTVTPPPAADGDPLSTSAAFEGVRSYSDTLDADLPLVAEFLDVGRVDKAVEVLVAFCDYERELTRAEGAATDFFKRERRRSAFRIGDALVAASTRQLKIELYDLLAQRTKIDPHTLHNYRYVAAAWPPETRRFDEWDFFWSTFNKLAPLAWDDRLFYLDASASQKQQTGRELSQARLGAMLRESKGDLTPAEHRDIGTPPPMQSQVAPSWTPPVPAAEVPFVGNDVVIADLWGIMNRAVVELTDLLRPHVGEFEAARLRRRWLVEGQTVLGVVPSEPGSADLDPPPGGWLTPDQIEAA